MTLQSIRLITILALVAGSGMTTAPLLDPQAALAQTPPVGQSVEITEAGEVLAASGDAVNGAPMATSPLLPLENGQDAALTTGTLALLRRLEAARKDTQSIHATFHQIRIDESFMDKTESDGELWFRKPDHLRCDYADPQKMVNLVAGRSFYIYVPELNQAEYYQFETDAQRDQQLHELLIAFGFKTDDLAAHYVIRSSEDDPAVAAELRKAKMDPDRQALFVITPRPAYAQTCPFTVLHVYLDKAKLEPLRIWYKDQNFDASMTLEIQTIVLDAPVADELFDTRKIFAPGTEIIDKRNQQ